MTDRRLAAVGLACVASIAGAAALGSKVTRDSEAASLASPPLSFIRAVVIDPHDSNTVWAALDTGASLYRSGGGGRTSRAVGVLPQGQAIGSVAINRSGRNLYVSVRYAPQLWRSSDAGRSWRRVTTWPTAIVPVGMHRARPAMVSRLAVDPSRPGTVYAASENAVLRTTNAGRTWTRVSRGLPAGEPSYPWTGGDLVVDPRRAVLYLVTRAQGVYRTSNGGSRPAAAAPAIV